MAAPPPKEPDYCTGYVALVGRPNVGKSTLLNHVLGQKIAIASPRPQTTRNRVMGVRNFPKAQMILVDTPGLHKPSGPGRTRLNAFMVGEAMAALQEVDAVCLIVEAPEAKNVPEDGKPFRIDPGTQFVIDEVKAAEKPAVLAINKVDLLHNKRAMLPALAAYGAAHEWAAVVPISAKGGEGVPQLLEQLMKLLPPGEAMFPEEMVTDRAERWIGAEFIREQVFILTRQEVPYGAAVEIDRWDERGKDVFIEATVHVAKDAHKRIVVGEGGRMIREIGTRARNEISQLLAVPVHLKLFVRVTEGWTESERQLRDLGYGDKK
jgi:GTP-binding protein Era